MGLYEFSCVISMCGHITFFSLQLPAAKVGDGAMTSKHSLMLSQTKSSKQSMRSMHSMSCVLNPPSLAFLHHLLLSLSSHMLATKTDPNAHPDQ